MNSPERKSRLRRRCVIRIAASVCISATVLFYTCSVDSGRGDWSQQIIHNTSSAAARRPTIRTFFDPLLNHAEQAEQVEVWKRAWIKAGWDARTLGIDDARRHPSYKELIEQIDGLDWCKNVEFQRMCYIRWIAYAADGSGFVSDYDVLPLDANMLMTMEVDDTSVVLPNGGRFTGHDSLLAPLASGTGDEMTRILTAMIDAAKEHRRPKEVGYEDRRTRGMACDNDEKFQVTDMQALQILQHGMKGGKFPADTLVAPQTEEERNVVMHAHDFEEVLKGEVNSVGGEVGWKCPAAIHFSGRQGIEGYEDLHRDHRLSYMVRKWEEWRDMCKGGRESNLAAAKKAASKFNGGRSAPERSRRGVVKKTVLNVVASATLIATVVAALA